MMDKNNGKWDKLRIFSGAQLKYIAFLSMLMDHVNKALIYPFLSGEGIFAYNGNKLALIQGIRRVGARAYQNGRTDAEN